MNPYATYLGSRDPFSVITETPGQLDRFMTTLGSDGLEQSYAPGKWTAREILCHLADTEIAFAFRLRQARAEPHHVIQPFDQTRWAEPYSSFTARQALDTFRAIREWNLALLNTLPASSYEKRLTHPERGEMTFRVLIETMAGHDLNHLQQIATISSP